MAEMFLDSRLGSRLPSARSQPSGKRDSRDGDRDMTTSKIKLAMDTSEAKYSKVSKSTI